MARNGSGTYSLAAGNPVTVNTTIDASWANTTLTDLAAAMTGSVAADGQTPMSAPLKLDGGSASAPAITFNAEPSLGLFRPLTGILGFVTNGLERMRLVSGNLIIGSTADTTEALQVTGAAKITGALAVGGTVTVATPTTTGHATTKAYVDGLTSLTIVVVSGTSQTAAAGTHYVFTNTSAVTTITLPANPNGGDTIRFTNATVRTDHIVDRNTRLLFGLAENFDFDRENASCAIRYIDNTYGWRAV